MGAVVVVASVALGAVADNCGGVGGGVDVGGDEVAAAADAAAAFACGSVNGAPRPNIWRFGVWPVGEVLAKKETPARA